MTGVYFPALSLNPSTEGHYFSCYETAWECQDDGGESMKSLESDPEIEMPNKIIHQVYLVFGLGQSTRMILLLHIQTIKHLGIS